MHEKVDTQVQINYIITTFLLYYFLFSSESFNRTICIHSYTKRYKWLSLHADIRPPFMWYFHQWTHQAGESKYVWKLQSKELSLVCWKSIYWTDIDPFIDERLKILSMTQLEKILWFIMKNLLLMYSVEREVGTPLQLSAWPIYKHSEHPCH